MPIDPNYTKSLIGAAIRRGDKRAEADARCAHATAVLDKRIREVLASAPPLTQAQRAQLAALLTSGDQA